MADKIAKLLAKLPPSQLRLISSVITQIIAGELSGLDVKTMKRHKALYRVRVGNYRIIFTSSKGQETMIIAIARRNEKTYKGL